MKSMTESNPPQAQIDAVYNQKCNKSKPTPQSIMKKNKVQRLIQSIDSVQGVAQERTRKQPKTVRHGTNHVITMPVGVISQRCVGPGQKKKDSQEVQLEVLVMMNILSKPSRSLGNQTHGMLM